MISKSIRVLITAVGGDLGQAVVKSLRLSEIGIEIFGCDSNPGGVGGAFVDSCQTTPLAENSGQYVTAIESICRENDIHAVIPCSEPEIDVLSQIGPPLRLPSGAVIVCQPQEWIGRFGDKLRCMEALENVVPIAPFADGQDSEAVRLLVGRAGFPLVIKGRASWGSRSLRVAHDENELRFFLTEISAPVVQAYLDDAGGEFSVGLFACDEFCTVVNYKRELGPVGCTWLAETSEDAAVLDYASRVAAATGLRGSANLQVRKTSQGVRMLEINPRFSSLVAARAICGFRDAEWSLLAALKMKLPVPPPSYQHIRFRRYFHELVDFGDGFNAIENWNPRSKYANQ
ncbi:MAG TPA: ATP-grasp domain-containing protein [Opitutaceae bacterium]|nr:ATP-grasp domain-containing protein [Opitutaceae bacterium]